MSWQYLKTEAVPPMTLNFFHGPGGKKLEDAVSRTADNFIAGIQNKIKEMELEKLREIQRKEAEARLLQEKIKAEAKRKAEEAIKKREAQKLAQKDKAKPKATAKSAPEAKPKETAPDKKSKKKEVKKQKKEEKKKK